MPELKYGLNLAKKTSLPTGNSKSRPAKNIFDDEESSDDGNASDHARPGSNKSLGGLPTTGINPTQSKTIFDSHAKFPSRGPPKPAPPQSGQYGDISARHSSLKHARAAQEIDSNIYDYDSVYDSIHATPAKAKASGDTGPKYMTSLLAAAEVRKRDQLRAKEKALQREREEEGEDFADKDSFVTGAYKAQQAELRRLDTEEKLRDAAEMEKRRKQGAGMTGLYKDLLSREDERHERAMKAVAVDPAQNSVASAKQEDDGRTDDITVAKEKGAMLNEDGQIVDKRQLLSAGLNISRKAKTQDPNDTHRSDSRHSAVDRPGKSNGDPKRDMRERQTRMLEQQLADSAKRAADDEATNQEALERANKRRTTEKDASSAKERYLARKRAAEAAKGGGA